MRKLYDFGCDECGNEEEKFYQEGDILKCSKCGSEKMNKKLNKVKSFQFKGDGFYETDFKHK